MAPLPLNVAKNKRTSVLTELRKKLANVMAICNDPENLELNKLSTALNGLAETWQKYEESQQDVLGHVIEDEVDDEQVTFIEMEDIYKSAIDEINRITKDKGRAPRSERAVQLAAQMRDLHEQVRRIINCAKGSWKTQSRTTGRRLPRWSLLRTKTLQRGPL